MLKGSSGKGRASRPMLALAMAASCAILVAADQWTKALAASRLAGKGPVRVVGDFAVLVFTQNRGAFLSLGASLPPILRTVFLIVLPLAALGFFGWVLLRRGIGAAAAPGAAEFAVVALIAGGGLGNLVDRLLYGQVRDFINFGIGGLRTGIMNLADLYILAALIVMVVAFARRNKRPPAQAQPPDSSP